MNTRAIHEACKGKLLITSFNHLGLAMSYDEMRRYHNDMASYIADTNTDSVALPSHYGPGMFTSSAIDNLDHESASLYD